MLFRIFDREGLQLIPAVQFVGPLPQLETLRREDPDIVGLEWIGPDGLPTVDKARSRPTAVAAYNPLHPRVQQAMLAVIHELAQSLWRTSFVRWRGVAVGGRRLCAIAECRRGL